MSNVIDFLEKIGQDAELRYGDADVVIGATDDSEVRSTIKRAMSDSKNPIVLETLLGARTNVFCGIAPSNYEDESTVVPVRS